MFWLMLINLHSSLNPYRDFFFFWTNYILLVSNAFTATVNVFHCVQCISSLPLRSTAVLLLICTWSKSCCGGLQLYVLAIIFLGIRLYLWNSLQEYVRKHGFKKELEHNVVHYSTSVCSSQALKKKREKKKEKV